MRVSVRGWHDVINLLRVQPPRTVLRLPKGGLPHPRVAGMTSSVGLPEGQVADFRRVLPSGAGLHVKDFGSHYLVHIDEVHPDVNTIEHLRRDAPGVFIAGTVTLGAAVGSAMGRTRDSALAGAIIGGLVGAILASVE